ncbi:MAG: ceramidase domain-containing protein [Myxococcales bacterium]|nr:ceramidase domain-containing protein [Myxococcales bacterium]
MFSAATIPNPHPPGCFWHSYAESFGAPNVKWCEETLCQFVSEPANSWSNLGYLIAALAVGIVSLRRRDRPSLTLLSPVLFVLGSMSLLYHLSNFYGSQILDFVGMFGLVGWVVGMNLMRASKLAERHLLRFVIVLVVALTAVMQVMRALGLKYQLLIVLATLLISLSELLIRHHRRVLYRYFALSNLLLVIALGFSLSDVTRRFCDPQQHGWFSQGHALWHWISSLAMWTIFLHYSQPALRLASQKESS